jgi:hypothetical protein
MALPYRFWEPKNWPDIAECTRQRQELELLTARVADSTIGFRWVSYPSPWPQWAAVPSLAEHARKLSQRDVARN